MKSSMTQVSHRGMIIKYARFSRSAAADGTGYVTNKIYKTHEMATNVFS
ncbi:hypothetical protein U3A58_04895 [Algoriphagus sp. C2-6-M1]|nr:hypothetical protein [Algoriphagus sp. C2-6-M1]MEB2779722.1 hypothetical protein [Algoriphagus sp. C2-6-M1]